MSNGDPAKHSPARYRTYFEAHENNMRQLRKTGFVGEDTIQISPYAADLPIIEMAGEISCKAEIIVGVEKLIEVLEPDSPDPLIKTFRYSYNVFFRGGHNIFRYDNAHPRNDHVDKHHKHIFDLKSGLQIEGSPKWVGSDNWPTLGEVLWELHEWHCNNYGLLANPETFAVPQDIVARYSEGLLP